MATTDDLLHRVRGEFREMPGLRLTLAQACRLLHLDPDTCRQLLDHLVAERTLHYTGDGAYIAVSPVRPSPARASLHTAHDARRHG
jgi:hypothetical protein